MFNQIFQVYLQLETYLCRLEELTLLKHNDESICSIQKVFCQITCIFKVRHADINVAEILYWNLTTADSKATTFWVQNKIMYGVISPWVYLIDSSNVWSTFHHFKFGIPRFFTLGCPCLKKCKISRNIF